MPSRWESERAAWILGRSSSKSAQRRADLLKARARKVSRTGAGVEGASTATRITPWWGHRMVRYMAEKESERAWRTVLLGLILLVLAVTVGPAWLLAKGLYGAAWAVSPKTNGLRWWWFAPVAAISAFAVYLGGWETSVLSWHGREFSAFMHLPWPSLNETAYLAVQVPIAFALATWWVWSWGWEAVGGGVGASSKPKISTVKAK